MQKYSSGIEENLSVAKIQLDKLSDDISNTMERISTREKHLNNHLEPLLIEYKTKQVGNQILCCILDKLNLLWH